MKKGQNLNHPKAGSRIAVEPIRELRNIQAIKKLLQDVPLYSALFILGINTNLRASDLLAIRIDQVRGLKPMDEIDLREKKTGNIRRVSLNKACVEACKALLAVNPGRDDEPLLRGQRGPLTVPTVNRLVKGWCRAINLKGNYGAHTLRKTWGYHQRVTFGIGLPELMTVYGHATQRQTLTYLCVQPDEVKNVYANII
jgi:integrase